MNNKKVLLRVLRGALLVLLALHLFVIFHFSNEAAPQSDRTSTSFIETLLQSCSPSFSSLSPEQQTQKVQSLQKTVRTLAHMAEFAWLGMLVCALLVSFRLPPKWMLCGLLGCALTALGDEGHQLLIPGRTFQWEDVAVDTCGAALGMAAVWLIVRLVARLQRRIKEKKGTA